MKAEIISIGSEITSGQNLDTNAQWLSRRLAELGIPVGFHTTVADDLSDNLAIFRLASQRANLVISTGGLGPTQDDLTRDVLAEVAGVPLVYDPASFEHIQQMFAKRGRVMPERNRVQAYHPQGSEMVFNAVGTAPGIWMKIGDCYLAALPGVPSEMYLMFQNEIVPRLKQVGLGGGGVFVQRKINTFGWGESAVEEKFLDLPRRGHVPEVGITASDATISLRILARAENYEAVEKLIAPVELTIRQRLGSLVYGFEEEELQHAVVKLLNEKRQTLCTAESVTGGLIAHRITQVAGASEWFYGGVVTYTDAIKHQELGVPLNLLEQYGAVSQPVAEAMAQGALRKFRTDLAVATTGFAGPSGGTEENPVGTVYTAIATRETVASLRYSWFGNRQEIQSRAAKLALNLVRLKLLELPTPAGTNS
ncbi:MAG: competence/damage-inducible protein A [Gemmataceae bacterium]|nr:competence/damage-inducible protein A [Gemmataceae bacterium]